MGDLIGLGDQYLVVVAIVTLTVVVVLAFALHLLRTMRRDRSSTRALDMIESIVEQQAERRRASKS